MAQLTGPRGMQDCFRLHPEMYASELEDDEDEVEEELRAREAAPSIEETTLPSADSGNEAKASEPTSDPASAESKSVEQSHLDSSSSVAVNTQSSGDSGQEPLPKVAHDAGSK